MSEPLAVIPSDIHQMGSGMATFGPDSRLIVRFYRKPIRNEFQTQMLGTPVFDQYEMVSIRQPGERDEGHFRATEEHRDRFPRQWAQYQAGQEQAIDGTPLEVMFEGEPEIMTMLRTLKFQTLEQLAGATEQAIQRMGMGARNWVDRAQRLLAGMAGGAATIAMQNEIETLRVDKLRMEQKMKELGDKVAELSKKRRVREDVE